MEQVRCPHCGEVVATFDEVSQESEAIAVVKATLHRVDCGPDELRAKATEAIVLASAFWVHLEAAHLRGDDDDFTPPPGMYL